MASTSLSSNLTSLDKQQQKNIATNVTHNVKI